MQSTNLFKTILLGTPLLALAGCGGSNGLSNGFPSQPSSVGNPTGPGVNGGSAMAALAFGRTFQYAVSGTITKDYLDSAGTKHTFTGAMTNATLTREISDGSGVLGVPGFQITDTLTFTVQGTAPSVEVSTWYLMQAGDNSLSIAGANQYNYLTEPAGTVPFAPGTFTTSTNLSSGITSINFPNDPVFVVNFTDPAGKNPIPQTYNIVPGDGTIETSFTALGQESVPTTKGAAYTAWKTQYSQTTLFNDDGLYHLYMQDILPSDFVVQSRVAKTSTDDWVPSLGAPVRMHQTLSETDQVATSYQFNLGAWNTTPGITYTSQQLTKKETLDLALVSQH